MNRQSAFTLVELVIVVVLLGILSAVALPMFFNLSEDANDAVAKNLKGALKEGINTFHIKWQFEGGSSTDKRMTSFGSGSLIANPSGYPIGDTLHTIVPSTESVHTGSQGCVQIARHLLDISSSFEFVAPAVLATVGPGVTADFIFHSSSLRCFFIKTPYQHVSGANIRVTYDAATGSVTATDFP